jgi:Domain of unknown function (DUF4288)
VPKPPVLAQAEWIMSGGTNSKVDRGGVWGQNGSLLPQPAKNHSLRQARVSHHGRGETENAFGLPLSVQYDSVGSFMGRTKSKHALDYRWWAVRALYVCDVAAPHSSKRPTVEERLFLIKSSTFPKARRKAEKVAKKEQAEYKNYLGETVHWRLIQLLEIQEIIAPRIRDQVEVYFRLYRNSKPEWIINRLRYRRGSVLNSKMPWH